MTAEELESLAQRCQRLEDFDSQERVDLNNDLHDVLPEPKCVQAPSYHRSLDAAVSLIPAEHAWIIEHVNGGLTICARVGHNDPERFSWGETAALALCAAALRARAELLAPK